MILKRTLLAAPAVLALALSACAGGAGNTAASGDAAASGGAVEATTGIITANGSEPQNPLIPGNTSETGGGRVVDLLFSRLVNYKADGSTEMDAAQSITTEDNITWTVKLRQDGKFSDGTPVLAKNFVEAWKLTSKEQMKGAYFFAPVEGADEEGNGDLTGLKVVDDYTFTIKLKQAESDFPSRLGYAVYSPLPDSTLKDIKTGGEKPIGNGPYKLADSGWEHKVKIALVPNETYTGPRTPKNGGVTFMFYDSLDAAYADISSDNLDVLDAIPDSALANYQQDFADRSVNDPTAIFQSFTIPARLKHFSGEEGKLRRQAISYAINREEITEKIFNKTRTPAKDFTSPVVAGYNDKVPGNELLTYDPAKAKELWAKADAISKWEGTFEIAYNAEGGHQTWVDAVSNSIKNTLGIQAQGKPYADFKSFRDDITNRKITTAFRTGWQADYPGKYNFLAPIYGTGAGSNDGDYSSAAVDKLLVEASAAKTPEEANTKMDLIQQELFKDLPAIPLWYSNVNGAWSTKVSNVTFTWNSVPEYHNITKAE
ncbi:MAG: ABC transporter substrate-binding protein [Actinomycetaceae bacterium]|nr:ABC transporter substrate-binding protein [Actinomycetaceae bacterium]